MLLDFLLCFAAWTALALAMDRHHEDAWPGIASEAPAAVLRRQRLAQVGWALLALSLGMALGFPGATTVAMSAVVWTAALPCRPWPLPPWPPGNHSAYPGLAWRR